MSGISEARGNQNEHGHHNRHRVRRNDTATHGLSDQQTGEIGAMYEAINVPPDYLPLDFRPNMLKRPVTITICVFYAGLTAAMTLLAIMSSSEIPYAIKSDTYYFAVRYGPGLVGAISTFLFRSTSQEVLRMLPYINMADPKGYRGAQYTVLARYWPILLSQNTKGTHVNFWLQMVSNALMAYKSVLLEVISNGTTWVYYVHTALALPLIVYYALMSAYMLTLTIWMWNKSTGLREDCDPQCLTDIMALFAHFNEDMDDNDRARRDFVPPTIPDRCYGLDYRLGYWLVTSRQGKRVAYGIRSCSSTRGSLNGVKQETRVAKLSGKRGRTPYLYNTWAHPWFWLCILFAFAWLGLISLLIAMGYVEHDFALLEDWSLMRLDHLSNGTLYSITPNITLTPAGGRGRYFLEGEDGQDSRTRHLIAANFLLRFLPIMTLSLVANQMIVQDAYHRFLQPLYNMSQKEPVSATDSILLDYLNKTAFGVTAQAFTKSHWKVFVFSILGSAPEFLMLLPYGILTLTSIGDVIVCSFSIPSFSGTCALVSIWLTALLSALPSGKRRIPRPNMSLLDIWSMCHSSHVAKQQCYARCESYWTKDHLHGEVVNQNHKYSLGICYDDSKTRIGFDICSWSSTNQITPWVERVRPRHLRFWKNRPGGQKEAFGEVAADGHGLELMVNGDIE